MGWTVMASVHAQCGRRLMMDNKDRERLKWIEDFIFGNDKEEEEEEEDGKEDC